MNTAASLSVKVKPRNDGRGYYANVRHPGTGARRQLSWPTEVDGQRFVAILARDGWEAAMADYTRLRSVRSDRRSEVAAGRTMGRTLATATLDYIATRKSESTRRSYRGRMNLLTAYPGGLLDTRLDRITAEELAMFAKWLQVQDAADSVAFNTWALVSQVFNREVKVGNLLGNPCTRVEDKPTAPKAADGRDAATLVDPAEVEAIVGLAPDEATALLFRLLYATAMRFSEALALQPRHFKVDGDAMRIIVQRTMAHDEHGGGWHIGPTKGKNIRTVYVPRALGDQVLALGVHAEGDAAGCLAFPKHSATQMRWGVMRDRAAALGVAPAGVRIHDLRHSRITYLVEAGGNIVGISRMAGHASVQFTLDRYSHVRDDVARGLAFL